MSKLAMFLSIKAITVLLAIFRVAKYIKVFYITTWDLTAPDNSLAGIRQYVF